MFARYWGRRKNKVIQARGIWERNRSLSPQPLRLFCVTFYCTTLHYYLEDWNRISLGSAQCYLETSFLQLSAKRAFPLSRNFYLRTYVKFTFANKIKAMYRTSHVKVEPRSTSRLSSTLYVRVHARKDYVTVVIHPNRGLPLNPCWLSKRCGY